MQPAFDRTSYGGRSMMPPRLVDPARGVGQALRTTYMPAKSNMPQEIQELLDRLDGAGTDRA